MTSVSARSTPRSSIARESASFPLVTETLRSDGVEMQREMLLRQRWLRYAVAMLAMLATLALALPAPDQARWAAPVAIAALYALVAGLSTLALERRRLAALRPYVPAALMFGDVVLAAAFVYASAGPMHANVVLLVGLLVLQLTLFHFGLALAMWVGALSIAGYVLIAVALPPLTGGDARPAESAIVFNTIAFLFASAVLVLSFGNFRERMNRLRELCKRVESGDLSGGGAIAGDGADRPDDLALLTRSFSDMRERLIELVGTDALTGCLNRRAFELRLGREWRQSRRRDSMLALVAIDLDRFKPINDEHGHGVGDTVLRELSEIMIRSARDTDAVARVGGDEFVVLLPDSTWQGATVFAERVRHTVDDRRFGGDAGLEVTISVGVAVARGTDNITPEHLLEEADRQLYKSKLGGRNRVSR